MAVAKRYSPQMIRRHEFNRLWSEDAFSVEFSAVQQHLEEPCVVSRGRQESSAAREALPGPINVRTLTDHMARVRRPFDAATVFR